MAKYYFNLHCGPLHVADARGEECRSPAEALEYAMVAVLDLITKEGRLRNWAKWSVEIEDEARHCVATLPFTMVAQEAA